MIVDLYSKTQTTMTSTDYPLSLNPAYDRSRKPAIHQEQFKDRIHDFGPDEICFDVTGTYTFYIWDKTAYVTDMDYKAERDVNDHMLLCALVKESIEKDLNWLFPGVHVTFEI